MTISSYENISKQPRIYFELSNTLRVDGTLGIYLSYIIGLGLYYTQRLREARCKRLILRSIQRLPYWL